MRAVHLAGLTWALAAGPALAQHEGHVMPAAAPAQADHGAPEGHGAMDAADPAAMDQDAMDHSTMDHSTMDHGAMDHSLMDHSTMDHATMDHSAMDQDVMAAVPRTETPPPPAAGSGPARAADAIWGAQAMRASRAALKHEVGGMRYFWAMADRAEYRLRDGTDAWLWDGQASYGGDLDKLWLKSEGEVETGHAAEQAEVQALWSHAIAPFFDLQAGVRHDFAGPARTHAVIGVQGLAPYRFEIDAAAFLSDQGELTGRIEVELDERITQRLILQPRVEMDLAAQHSPELGVGAGLSSVEAGLRLRYEFAREFAPYLGIEQEWRIGRSARYARAAGNDPSVTNFVVGVRFWF